MCIRDSSCCDRAIHFSSFTCRADYQPLSVLLDHGFRQSRSLVKILQVRVRNELVDILQALLCPRDQDYVVRRFFLVLYRAVFIVTVGIVEHISFHTVYYLDVHRIFLVAGKLLRRLGGVREALHHTMVGDRNCRLPPRGCSLYEIRDLVETVHRTHPVSYTHLDVYKRQYQCCFEAYLLH